MQLQLAATNEQKDWSAEIENMRAPLPQEELVRLGRLLAELRVNAGRTQLEVATMLGRSTETTIYRIEHGALDPFRGLTAVELNIYFMLLGVTAERLAQLMGYEGPEVFLGRQALPSRRRKTETPPIRVAKAGGGSRVVLGLPDWERSSGKRKVNWHAVEDPSGRWYVYERGRLPKIGELAVINMGDKEHPALVVVRFAGNTFNRDRKAWYFFIDGKLERIPRERVCGRVSYVIAPSSAVMLGPELDVDVM